MPPLMALPQSKMARLRLILLLLVLLCVAVYRYFLPFYWYCHYSPAEGDIIFQSLHSMDLVEAIEGITESPYSHVGLVVNKYGRWYVREAMVNVHDTPLEQWVRQGRWGQFAVYQLDEHLKADIPAFIKASEKYLYRPYDVKYELDDGKIYCSELLYKAYLDATGRTLGELIALGDMNWRPYRQTIIKYEGGQPPLERLMITPRHMSESDYLGPKLSFGL